MINFDNNSFTQPLASVVAAVNDFTDSYRKYPSSFKSPKREVIHPMKIYHGAVKYIRDYFKPSSPSILLEGDLIDRLKDFDIFEISPDNQDNLVLGEIKRISDHVHKQKCYSLLNADHFIARNQLSLRELGVDFLLARGSTFYAPYGGVICIAPMNLFPNIHMEVSQQPNMIPIVAMAEALKSLNAVTFPIINQKEKSLCSYITKKLSRSTQVNITPKEEQTHYVNLNLTTQKISPPVLAKRLEEEGIFVGYDHNGLKLSFSFINSNEEIDLFVEKLNLFLRRTNKYANEDRNP